eukprot:CAMPEP_0171722986 /NCGR_PEP_ID=MMETSP0991-20121206/23379_1 /TAXON_ID=483369 /ORGANISM="non described non described, Strain CCMP2098" /LENGTH=390 /DNA_ID=CAMNT_0012315347 /DNA_START=16 /DNA_END=1188 /DNA_ORIENTATION=-
MIGKRCLAFFLCVASTSVSSAVEVPACFTDLMACGITLPTADNTDMVEDVLGCMLSNYAFESLSADCMTEIEAVGTDQILQCIRIATDLCGVPSPEDLESAEEAASLDMNLGQLPPEIVCMATKADDIAAENPECADLVAQLIVVLQTLVEQEMAGCADDVVKAEEVTGGLVQGIKGCETAAAQEKMCATVFCPTCQARGLCDASCGYCLPSSPSKSVPANSPTVRPANILGSGEQSPSLSPTKLVSNAVDTYSTVMAVLELGSVLAVIAAIVAWWFCFRNPNKRAADNFSAEARAMDFYDDDEDNDEDTDGGLEMSEGAPMNNDRPSAGSSKGGSGGGGGRGSSMKPFSDDGGGRRSANKSKYTKSGHGALMQEDEDNEEEDEDWSEEI